MTFRDQRLDPYISYGAEGGPEFLTIIAQSESGDEARDSLRSKALGTWDVSYHARMPDVWKPLRAHFLIMGGRRDTWPLKDWLDFECSSAESVLVAIDSTHWQMYKRYSFGGVNYDYKIVLPITATTAIAGGGTYSVGRTTGIITKSSGSDPTSFSTEFDKLVRYDTDVMKADTIDKSGSELIVGWSGIPIKEVRA